MGRLTDFRDYLDGRLQTLARAEQRLCDIQAKYEEFYGEISRVRETELQQLRNHVLEDRDGLPKEFNVALDAAWAEAEQELEEQVRLLTAERDRHLNVAERQRNESIAEERKIHGKNETLDDEEEALKARNEKLLARIEDHNRRINELGRGFGFFKNLFAMRRMQRERHALIEEQGDVAARIEKIRFAWVDSDKEWAAAEEQLKKAWVEEQTEAQAVQTKVDHLASTRSRIVERSAVEKVLYAREPKLAPAGDGDPKCPRCEMPNPKTNYFCAICARRLHEDRLDFDGSLLEIAELNRHHANFSDGMKACQEIIGLVRGLRTGLTNFAASVNDMITTERTYPLAKLQISVPASSVAYGEHFDKLEEATALEVGLHPTAFAAQIRDRISGVYQETHIKTFFETMGEELSRQADSQW